ncbi:MAG: PhzF family phenazine biosynthesis protein [Chitinophagales bacterium]
MKIQMYQVDAFTAQLFGGNPAAVCPLEHWLDKATMQAIAAENNLSETAFFIPYGNGFDLKWFTPTMEVDLCGHATLASAHVIFNHLNYPESVISFHSNSGLLMVSKTDDILTLNFPANSPKPIAISTELIEVLGKKPLEVYDSIYQMAVFESEKDIFQLQPDFAKLANMNSIIVTAPGTKSDFVSRFFAPDKGINEDPVTGSAHTILTPFWSERLGKKSLHALQVSERGGELWCEVLENDRVAISGKAVTYLEGTIQVKAG